VDIPRYLNLYKLGKLKLKEQITHRYPLDDINQAVSVVQSGQAGRCVVSMW
jgi:Zn-dependent alcohol dehydrogenase